MPEKLDRTRAFSEVWSEGGVTGYLQDGIAFDVGGKEVVSSPPVKLAAVPKTKPATFSRPPPVTGLAAESDDTLRGLIEIRGDEWQGREAALATLEGEKQAG